jgi:PAS domain S-box-containing protein
MTNKNKYQDIEKEIKKLEKEKALYLTDIEKYRSLIDNSPLGLFQETIEGQYIEMNNAFSGMLGYNNPDDTIKSVKDISSQIYVKSGEREILIRRLIKSSNIESYETLFRKTDNSVFPVNLNLRLICDERNKPLYVTGTVEDISGRKKTKESLLRDRNQLRILINNIPHMAWLKDNEGRYISVNESYALYHNLNASEIIGKTDYDLYPKKLADKYHNNDLKVMQSCKRELFEEVKSTRKGKQWIETFKTPIFDEQGKLTGITGISWDISDRKKMEGTIKENEEHFRELLQNSSDAISILDKKGKIIFESALRNRIFDFSIKELLNKPIFNIVHPDDIEYFREFFNEVLKNPRKQIKREYRCLHKNKKWIYVESIFSNQLDNPSINGIIVNSRDISERKMGELKERVYHDNLIFLSNSALDLLGISSKDDIYKYISEKLCNFLENSVVTVTSYMEKDEKFCIEYVSGLRENKQKIADVLGRNPEGLVFPISKDISNINNAGTVITLKEELLVKNMSNDNIEKLETIKEALKLHKIYNITLARHNKLLGNVTILTLNKSIIKFKHIIETFVHQVSVALHRSQLEYELVMAKEKAEESDKLKTAFLANMSHEIRTPMNGILGFAEMLNDDNLSMVDRKKYLDIINNNGKMLISLIDDIIDFAKIEAGQIKVAHGDFSLNSLLMQVHSSFLSESLKKEKSNVRLVLKKAFDNDNCYIKSDPNRIRQILTNLISNAFKFTNDGYIEFGYKVESKNKLMFYVKDTGIGIPPRKLKVIFERFIQADSSPTRKYGGSGLGLAISRGLVDLLGGKMWAESEVGKGSTFYFSVPYVATRKVDEEVHKEKQRTDYKWEGRLFLIAEDDKFSYKFLEGFLKQTKAEILHAVDGRQAVELCMKNKKIDLVLMDIQMPEMNGLEATEEIKKFNKRIPIIAQTANAITEERQKCLNAGCDDFVTKPVNINELYSKIDRWLSVKG